MSNIQLKNTQGKVVDVPAEQASDAVQNLGYSLPNQADLDTAASEAKYGGALEGLKSAGEGAVRGIIPGGGAVLNALGDTPEGQAGRKLAHPVVSGASEIAGLGAGLLAGTGEENIAADAVEGASNLSKAKSVIGAPTKAISKLGHAVTDAIAPEASSLAQRALGAGLGSAAEGAAYGLGQSVDESALGDPDAMGENLLHNVGYSALFAGGLGAALSKFTKPASIAEEALAGVGKDLGADSAAAGDAVAAGTPQQEGVFDHLRSENKMAPATKQAASDLGLPVFPEQISDSPTVKKWSEALNKRDDEIGIAEDAKRRDAYQKGSDVIQGTLSNVEGGTARETGDFIRDDLSNVVEQKAQPFNERYDKIEQFTGPIQVAPEQAGGLADEVTQLIKDNHLPKSGEQANFISGMSDYIREATTATELAKVRSSVLAQARDNFTLKRFAGEIAEKLSAAQEKLGLSAIAAMPEGAEKAAAQAAYQDSTVIGKEYAAFKKDLSRVGKKFGARSGAGPGEVISKMTDEGKLSSEQIAKRFMSTNDSASLEFLQKYAPNTFQAVMDREKSRILDAASKTGTFSAKAAIKEIDKLSPEIRGMVFKPEELTQIGSANHYLKSFPKEYFTSNTSTHAHINEHFSGMTAVAGALATGHPVLAAGALAKHIFGNKLTSLAMKEAIERLGPGSEGKVGALAMLENLNGKITNKINASSKALFNFNDVSVKTTAAGVIAKMVAKTDDQHDKLSDQITQYGNNPQKLIDDLSSQTEPLYGFAPNTASSLSKSAARATNFLKMKLPVQPSLGPLAPKVKFSTSQKAIFGNYLHGVENPISILDKLKVGTIVPQDIETLTAVYPKMFQQMQQSVYSAMVDHVDKNGVNAIPNRMKVGLSLFLGQDMDVGLTPQSVLVNQTVMNGAAHQQDQQEHQQTARPSQKGLSSLNKSQSLLTNSQQVSQRGVES